MLRPNPCAPTLEQGKYTATGHHQGNESSRKNTSTHTSETTHTPKHVFYARSSKGDRRAIQAQLDELEHTYGTPERTYTDSGSGLNENRRGLAQLIKDAQKHRYDTLYITYPDRLTRFGYTYLQELFNQNNITVISLHSKSFSAEEELMQDFMSLIASFAGRFYRLRSKENQKKLLKAAENTINSGGAA